MDRERYPGERRGLSLFLEELAPIVARELGPDHLLHHAARRALADHSLRRLRHARRLFNSLPRPVRQRLQDGIVGQPDAPPRREALMREVQSREAAAFVCFEVRHAGSPEVDRVELRHELAEDVPVRVMVRPGTLPSTTAKALREVADLVEADRRLLSPRHWRALRLLDHGDDEGNAGTA